jgi:hypothetical protein
MSKTEDSKRDAALDLLKKSRGSLIAAAKIQANTICRARGRVTSVEVAKAMKAAGYVGAMAKVDLRWMGAVFRGGSEWTRVGWEMTGSHSRPVTIWRRT